MTIVVHILHHGLPVCGFTMAMPNAWPIGHKWIGWDDPDKEILSCARCREKAGLIVTTKHWLQRIDSIFAVVADDEGGEGVVGAKLGDNWMPLIAADETRLKNIIPLAREIAKNTGQKMRIVKFSTREIVEEI